jgi:hypothetical protein
MKNSQQRERLGEYKESKCSLKELDEIEKPLMAYFIEGSFLHDSMKGE